MNLFGTLTPNNKSPLTLRFHSNHNQEREMWHLQTWWVFCRWYPAVNLFWMRKKRDWERNLRITLDAGSSRGCLFLIHLTSHLAWLKSMLTCPLLQVPKAFRVDRSHQCLVNLRDCIKNRNREKQQKSRRLKKFAKCSWTSYSKIAHSNLTFFTSSRLSTTGVLSLI